MHILYRTFNLKIPWKVDLLLLINWYTIDPIKLKSIILNSKIVKLELSI